MNGVEFVYLTAGADGPLALWLHGFPDIRSVNRIGSQAATSNAAQVSKSRARRSCATA